MFGVSCLCVYLYVYHSNVGIFWCMFTVTAMYVRMYLNAFSWKHARLRLWLFAHECASWCKHAYVCNGTKTHSYVGVCMFSCIYTEGFATMITKGCRSIHKSCIKRICMGVYLYRHPWEHLFNGRKLGFMLFHVCMDARTNRYIPMFMYVLV